MRKRVMCALLLLCTCLFTGCSQTETLSGYQSVWNDITTIEVISPLTADYTYGDQKINICLSGVNNHYDEMILRQLRIVDREHYLFEHYDGRTTANSDFIVHYRDDGTAAVSTSTKNKDEAVTIPANLDGKKVTTVRSMQCEANSFNIEEGILELDDYAFSGFFPADGHKYVEIPQSVNYIGYNCFEMDDYMISTYGRITEFNNLSSNPDFIIVGDQILLKYTGKDTVVTIPEGVKQIAAQAFENSNVEKVILADSVLAIGKSAFSNSALKEIVLNEGLKCIDEGAFANTAIINIALPNSLIYIGDEAFYDCGYLTDISIPDSIFVIGNRTFFSCKNLTHAEIGTHTIIIGDEAFYGVSDDFVINIPSSLISIGYAAFPISQGDYEEVLVEVQIETYTGENLRYYILNKNILVGFHGNTKELEIPSGITCITLLMTDSTTWNNVESIVFPSSLISIESFAFSHCNLLRELSLPSGVIYLGDSAFAYNESLQDITFPDTVRFIGTSCFTYCRNLQEITLPESLEYLNAEAFMGCEGLQKVNIGNPYLTLGGGVFKDTPVGIDGFEIQYENYIRTYR